MLVSPEERQVMYRTAYYPYMTKDQISALKTNISMNSDWIKNAKALDLAFNDILQGSFSNDAIGALQFAVIASCHYGQRLKSAYPVSFLVHCQSIWGKKMLVALGKATLGISSRDLCCNIGEQ